ncbi:hypothetical protein [Streptosporangium sp. NPDC003464]
MKRVIKAAVAVAAFGLAAAVCAPAQAQARDVFDGRDAAEDVSMAVEGLTGGLLDGRNMLSALSYGQDRPISLGGGRDPRIELGGGQAPFNGQSPFNGQAPFNGQSPFNGQTPFGGPAADRRDDGVDGLLGTLSDAVEDLVGVSPDGIALDSPLTGSTTGEDMLVDGADGFGDLAAAAVRAAEARQAGQAGQAGQVPAAAVQGLTGGQPEVGGLVDAVNQAVPQGAERAGTVAPLVGTLSPAEAAPVAGAVAPIVRSASGDEISPLVGNTTGEGARAVTETVHSVADSTMGATRAAAE